MTNTLHQAMIEALRARSKPMALNEDAKELAKETIKKAMDTEPANEEWFKSLPPKKQKKTKED